MNMFLHQAVSTFGMFRYESNINTVSQFCFFTAYINQVLEVTFLHKLPWYAAVVTVMYMLRKYRLQQLQHVQ